MRVGNTINSSGRSSHHLSKCEHGCFDFWNQRFQRSLPVSKMKTWTLWWSLCSVLYCPWSKQHLTWCSHISQVAPCLSSCQSRTLALHPIFYIYILYNFTPLLQTGTPYLIFMLAYLISRASCYISCLLHSCSSLLRWSWGCNATHGVICLVYVTWWQECLSLAAYRVLGETCQRSVQPAVQAETEIPAILQAVLVPCVAHPLRKYNLLCFSKSCLENILLLCLERSDSAPVAEAAFIYG